MRTPANQKGRPGRQAPAFLAFWGSVVQRRHSGAAARICFPEGGSGMRRKAELKISIVDPNPEAETRHLLWRVVLEAVTAPRAPEPHETDTRRPKR